MPEETGARTKRMRCAIYTRKSSEEGLEQEFNSLHAQREACEAFIASQRHEGWHVLSTHYDDGGFSGGSMDRPALQQLVKDVRASKIDVVVVYKIDRLTRSLFDFAKIVEAFDAHKVSFVSVTQQFNTTTSMGRLTLNVLLSFAQFEREVTSERIRDKIAASKQKGMWMGGVVPLGYDVVSRKLRINAHEAKTVRLLFQLYLELGSVRSVQEEACRLGLRSRMRASPDRKQSSGTVFSRGHLYRLLSSPIYVGRIPHGQRSYEGEHEGIIDAETWAKVQAQLSGNAGRRRGRANSKDPSLLAGLMFTAEGAPFTPSHAVNHGRRYRYYVERSLQTKLKADREKSAGPHAEGNEIGSARNGWRLPAHQIEQLVLKQTAAFLRDHRGVFDVLRIPELSPDLVSALLTRASRLADACDAGSPAEQSEIITALVCRVTVARNQVTIEIERKALADRLLDQDTLSTSEMMYRQTITIEVPVTFRRRGVEAKLLVPGRQQAPSEPDANLVKALTRAHEWFGRIARGEVNGPGDIAKSEGLCRTFVTRVLCLAFLAPEIARSILEGRQPLELTTKRLTRSVFQIPLLWADQRAFLGLSPDGAPLSVKAREG